jgi:TIGR03009 family protein
LPLPEAQPMRVPKLSPELEQILADWESHSSQIKKLTGSFERHKYDHTFKVEFSAQGKFAYEAPDRGAYEFEGVKVAEGALSRMKDEDENPYSLKSDQPEHWVCTGEAVLLINHKDKNFTKVEIPPEHRGENIIDGPLPFLFGMKAEQAKRRYVFELLPPKKSYPDAIRLGVTPRLDKDSSNWCEAQVIINRETFLPIAVRLVAPGRNSETVHHFKGLTVNGKASLMEFFGKRDPFNPDLRNYKPVLSQKGGTPGDPSKPAPDVSTKPGTPSGAKARAANPAASDRDLQRSADTSAGSSKKPAKSVR